MSKFEITFYCREPLYGVTIIEADSADDAKRAAWQQAHWGTMDVDEWSYDGSRSPTYTVHKVMAVKPE